MRRLLPLLLAVALLAGCGNSSGSGSKASAGPGSSSLGGAEIAPSSTTFLLRLNTAFDSQQWQTLDALLKKLPDGEKLLSSIGGKGVDFNADVKPALGPEADALALNGVDLNAKTLVGMTQPQDEAKFKALLAKGGGTPPATEDVAGWQVVADKQATIDRFKAARQQGLLADNSQYKDAIRGLPDSSLATLYLNGGTLASAINKRAKTGSSSSQTLPGVGSIGWLSGAATAVDNGLTLEFRLKAQKLQLQTYTPELPAEVPADVALLVDFKGLDSALEQLRNSPALKNQLGPAQQALGGLLDEVVALFKNEGAFYVQPGAGKSAYALVLKVEDEASARATLDKLGTLVGAFSQKTPQQVTVGGATVEKLTLSAKTSVYYGVVGGKVVVTNSEASVRDLGGSGERLADSQAWKDATAAAEMPDKVSGILYADVHSLVPLLEKLQASSTSSSGSGSSSSTPTSPEVKRNLAALGSLLLYGSADGDVATAKGFLAVR